MQVKAETVWITRNWWVNREQAVHMKETESSRHIRDKTKEGKDRKRE